MASNDLPIPTEGFLLPVSGEADATSGVRRSKPR
jgi:hypothetical protein